MRLVRDLILLVFVLAGAIGGSQVPQFVQQYLQRLGGALQIAQEFVGKYEPLARSEGLTIDAFARQLADSADPKAARLGQAVLGQVERTAALEEHAELLTAAAPLVRPWELIRHHDAELLAGTWRDYRYTLTLDPVFGAAGAFAGLLLTAMLWSTLVWIGRAAGAKLR
jgi:hypothetical protein